MPQSIYSKYSTDELWGLCITNDHKAFKALYDREFQSLFAFGLKICQHKPDIKDALQEIFTDLWVKRSTRKINHIRFYLLKSLKYKLVKARPNTKIIDLNALPKDVYSSSITVNNAETDSEEIQNIISQLPKNQQEILHLKYYQGLTNSQIAEVLGIKYQSVSNRLHRLHMRFRKKIQKKISF